eukprot:PhF_6_TR31423/c1_g1_i3/m.46071/K10582/UBE2Q; ubiquitin-conjugating enzyme E2 Q
MSSNCPMCGRSFPTATIHEHVNDCLDMGEIQQLTRNEQPPPPTNTPQYPCGICSKPCPLDALYILDECNCRFHRECAAQYAQKEILTNVTVKCPRCPRNGAFTVRDCENLCPKEKLAKHLTTASSSKRLMAELRYMTENPDLAKSGISAEVAGDNLYLWHCKLFGFDSSDGPLADDMKRSRHSHLLLSVAFPTDYPRAPPFIRVIRPRLQYMTGHVTIGGSICTEMLTNQGWSPMNTIEAALISIRANLIEGGARIDTGNKSDYTEAEAKDAFTRMVRTHGWQH